MSTSILIKDQSKKWVKALPDGKSTLIASVQHDDRCGNGHNTFSVTGELRVNGRIQSYGMLHDLIAEHFPDIAPFLKWHLCSTDGPTYYVANTVYHVLEHGPKSAWVYFTDKPNGIEKQCVKYCDIEEAHKMCQIPQFRYNYVSQVGYRLESDPKTAKVRNLDSARRSAIWPDATDEDLTAPGLEQRLQARLPALMEEFQKAVESFGFTY